MQTRTKSQQKIILLCVSAFLSALSIVLGKYLAINLGDTIRLSFENLPILFAGLYFGPVIGLSVGVVADLLGCVMVGYSINPVITLGAALIGLVSGILGKVLKPGFFRVFLSVTLSHILGSIFVKTLGLYWYFKMPFFPTLGMRSITYLIIAICEISILYFLAKSNALNQETKKMIKKGENRHDL